MVLSMIQRHRPRIGHHIRNYVWLFGTVLTYGIFSYWFEQYIAIVAANVAFLGFFTLIDFESYLKLERMRSRCDAFVVKEVETIQSISVVVGLIQYSTRVILRLSPSQFAGSSDFSTAFRLRYLVDDTASFIVSFSENVKRQFFVTLLVGLFIFVLFLNTIPIQQTRPVDVRIIVAIATFIINGVYLLRPL